MSIGGLPSKLRSIGGGTHEGLFIRDKLVIFDEDVGFRDMFGSILVEILRCGVEVDVFLLILDSGDDLFSHLRFSSWEIFAIFGVNVVIRSVGFSFWMGDWLLSGGGFFQVLMGCLVYSF